MSTFNMSTFDNMLLKLDETLTSFFGDWDIYSTSIAAAILVFFAYQVFTRRDPDTHPMLLERQAHASPVRNPGESAIYRSQSSTYGMELSTGLNVRDPGISKWTRGRDGDLRDIWRKVVDGPTDESGKLSGGRGRIMTILGSESVIEHNLDEISGQISIIGTHIKQQGGSRVAVYLPNSIEFLTTLFACAFSGVTPILLSYDQPSTTIISMLKRSDADTLIAAVGSVPFDAMAKEHPSLRQVIWVVDEGSKHMDWDEVPKGTGGAINVSTWQEIIEDNKSSNLELPKRDHSDVTPNLVAFWQSRQEDSGQLVEYTQSNLISAVSAQLAAIPVTQRLSSSDLFLPIDSLSTVYPLVMTLTALYCNSSLALHSVAGRNTRIQVATQGIAPTIIVASASTLSEMHKEATQRMSSAFVKAVHWSQTRTLTQDGVMPVASLLSRLNDSMRPAIGTTPGKLRAIFVSEQAGGDAPALSSLDLSDLRILTGARIIYALTAAKVAGAVSQTSFYDYRVSRDAGKHCHFGPPLSSVEVLLRDTKEHKTTDTLAVGEIVARGPAVVSGEAALGVIGTIRPDHTLAYL